MITNKSNTIICIKHIFSLLRLSMNLPTRKHITFKIVLVYFVERVRQNKNNY